MPESKANASKKKSIVMSPYLAPVKSVLRRYGLHTVCESAKCPNIGDCFRKKTATFLIMGNICTRNCRFCNIGTAENIMPPDPAEPGNIASAAAELGLDYIVITSVTRDDLTDGGAAHFANVINAVRAVMPDSKIEVLTPDFKGDKNALKTVALSKPDVFNHNLETVASLYSTVRPQAEYKRSLEVLSFMKKLGLVTKSGIMAGLGESEAEVKKLMADLRSADCDILTIGQYFRPTQDHLRVERELGDEEFEGYRKYGLSLGFKEVYSGRYVRSSFNAGEVLANMEKRKVVA